MNPNDPNVVLRWGIAALDQEGAGEILASEA